MASEKSFSKSLGTAGGRKISALQVIESAEVKNVLKKVKIGLDKSLICDTLILVDKYAPT